MRHTGGLPRRDQYGRSTEDLWSRSPFLDSFLLADDTLSGVASEHGPVSFRTECLIPWTVGKSFGLDRAWIANIYNRRASSVRLFLVGSLTLRFWGKP